MLLEKFSFSDMSSLTILIPQTEAAENNDCNFVRGQINPTHQCHTKIGVRHPFVECNLDFENVNLSFSLHIFIIISFLLYANLPLSLPFY